MGLFWKKKENKPELKKIELIINRETLRAEYRCPYCKKLLAEGNPKLIEKPEIEFCPNYSKEFIV